MSPHAPQKNGAPMGLDIDQYCRYRRCKHHSTNDNKNLKRDIETLIHKGFLKHFITKRGINQTHNCKDRRASPVKRQDALRAKKATLNVIGAGFAFGRETISAREMHASQISEITIAVKYSRTENGVDIFFSESKMEHVTCPHGDALVIIIE